MKFVKLSAFVFLILVIAAGCKKAETKSALDLYVSFFTGQVTIQRNGVVVPTQIKTPLQNGDTITTDDKSFMIIQGNDGLQVRIENGSQIKLSLDTTENGKIVSLFKGSVLSKVNKLVKNSSYKVTTATMTAAVRGTQFLIKYDGTVTAVAVGEGKVAVNNNTTVEPIVIEAGNAAVSVSNEKELELRENNTDEIFDLKNFEEVPVIDEIEDKTVEEIQKEFGEVVKAKEEVKAVEEEKKKSEFESYDDLKATYGRLDVITMFNGRVIKGVIVKRGAIYTVQTLKSKISVNEKDIRRTDSK